jgi:hypothetical protein
LKPAIKSASRQSDRFFRIQMQHLCGGLGWVLEPILHTITSYNASVVNF